MGYLFLKYISGRSVAILTIVPNHGTNDSLYDFICWVYAT